MSPKQLILDWFELVWNQGNADFIDQHLAPKCYITGLDDDTIRTPEEFHVFHAKMNGLFRELEMTVEEVIEQGGTAAGVVSVSAVHRGTGNPVSFDSHFFAVVEGDQIVEARNQTDFLSVMVQIGAMHPAEINAALMKGMH